MRRVRFILVGALAGVALPLVAAIPGSATTTAPGPVTNVVAAVSGDQATVSWTPPASGGVARYDVSAILGAPSNQLPGYGDRLAGPTATSLVWDRLPFNTEIQFSVVAIGADGSGNTSGPSSAATTSAWVAATDALCPSGATGDCVVVAPNDPLEPEVHEAAGVEQGETAPGNALTQALGLTHWRVDAGSTADTQAASYVGMSNTIELLSGAWLTLTRGNNSYAESPWENWAQYTQFITQTVQAAESAGQDPLWEIQNEPENYAYDPNAPATRSLVEQEYLTAYNAIKAVDPNARVLGPSIDWFYEDTAVPIDMKTFIPFAAANNMKLYAIAWHDNGDATMATPETYFESPQVIRDHAEEARELIAENPGIGTPLLFVDENSSSAGSFIPGFAAGYVAEAERASVSESNRSCWVPPGSTNALACYTPTLSNLLNPDGMPTNSYWVMANYATMNGTTVWSNTSDTNVSSLAVTDTSGDTRLLLGRHQTCSWWTVSTYCPAPAAANSGLSGLLSGLLGGSSGTQPAPASIATTVHVTVPPAATSVAVTVQELSDGFTDQAVAPASTTTTVKPIAGVATFSIPAFSDGEAYFATVVPNVGSFPPGDTGTSPAGPPTPPVPTTLSPVGNGVSQSTTLEEDFPNPLEALVADQYGNPVSGVTVTFQVPANELKFTNGSTNDVATTNAQGVAMSALVMGQLSVGTFTGTASVPGLTGVGYSLTVNW